ncbi:hypothetical protein MPSEU_000043000 [Mayamaea pseudoterrestris]|nr:hypothetical protein MPSEU_000043000 [Mayamaea pseudoterrestris]
MQYVFATACFAVFTTTCQSDVVAAGAAAAAFVTHHDGSRTRKTLPVFMHESNTNINEEFVSPSQLLYKEQEKMLVERGKLEANIMACAPTSILTASVVKGVGSGGGFGGVATKSTRKKHGKPTKASSMATLKSNQAIGNYHAAELQTQGVIRIDKVISDATADRMRNYVFQLRQQSEALVRQGSVDSLDLFANVLLQNKRCDLKLPLLVDNAADDDLDSTVVVQALYELLVASPVGATMNSLLGPDAVLQELSCLTSDPGSDRQVVHPDTPCRTGNDGTNDEAVLYTCFVALQDVRADMGPTTWLPKTHTYEIHQVFQDDFVPTTNSKFATVGDDNSNHNISTMSPKNQLLQSQPIVLGMLPKGSCGIFDSRLLHCGGANTSETSRSIFYVSFKHPSVGYSGNPPSIRPELVNQFTLGDLEEELTLFYKKKPTRRIMRNDR